MEIEMTIGKMPIGIDKCNNELSGFRFLWIMYVTGFKREENCQKCLKGKLDDRFLGKPIMIDQTYILKDPTTYNQIYICAEPYKKDAKTHLTSLKDWKRAVYPYPGLQLALQPEQGSNVSLQTFNGVAITITNVRKLEIPYLPDGFAGMEKRQTRCCVWQFGVSTYGLVGE